VFRGVDIWEGLCFRLGWLAWFLILGGLGWVVCLLRVRWLMHLAWSWALFCVQVEIGAQPFVIVV
jgi:hypothetical protein